MHVHIRIHTEKEAISPDNYIRDNNCVALEIA